MNYTYITKEQQDIFRRVSRFYLSQKATSLPGQNRQLTTRHECKIYQIKFYFQDNLSPTNFMTHNCNRVNMNRNARIPISSVFLLLKGKVYVCHLEAYICFNAIHCG